QPDQCTQWRAGLTGGKKGGGALHQISRPDQMVAPQVVIAFGFTPRYTHRSNHGPLKYFVFVGQQYATAQAGHPTPIAGVLAEVEFGIDHNPLPLAYIPFPVGLKWLGQGLKQSGGSTLITAPTGNGDRKLAVVRHDNFAG